MTPLQRRRFLLSLHQIDQRLAYEAVNGRGSLKKADLTSIIRGDESRRQSNLNDIEGGTYEGRGLNSEFPCLGTQQEINEHIFEADLKGQEVLRLEENSMETPNVQDVAIVGSQCLKSAIALPKNSEPQKLEEQFQAFGWSQITLDFFLTSQELERLKRKRSSIDQDGNIPSKRMDFEGSLLEGKCLIQDQKACMPCEDELLNGFSKDKSSLVKEIIAVEPENWANCRMVHLSPANNKEGGEKYGQHRTMAPLTSEDDGLLSTSSPFHESSSPIIFNAGWNYTKENCSDQSSESVAPLEFLSHPCNKNF